MTNIEQRPKFSQLPSSGQKEVLEKASSRLTNISVDTYFLRHTWGGMNTNTPDQKHMISQRAKSVVDTIRKKSLPRIQSRIASLNKIIQDSQDHNNEPSTPSNNHPDTSTNPQRTSHEPKPISRTGTPPISPYRQDPDDEPFTVRAKSLSPEEFSDITRVISMGLTNMVLSRIRIQGSLDEYGPKMSRDPEDLIQACSITESQASSFIDMSIKQELDLKKFVADSIVKAVENSWNNQDNTQPHTSQERTMLILIRDLKDKDISAEDIIRTVYRHFKVTIPDQYKTDIPEEDQRKDLALKAISTFRKHPSRHGSLRLE